MSWRIHSGHIAVWAIALTAEPTHDLSKEAQGFGLIILMVLARRSEFPVTWGRFEGLGSRRVTLFGHCWCIILVLLYKIRPFFNTIIIIATAAAFAITAAFRIIWNAAATRDKFEV